jgi:hypothetical protein
MSRRRAQIKFIRGSRNAFLDLSARQLSACHVLDEDVRKFRQEQIRREELIITAHQLHGCVRLSLLHYPLDDDARVEDVPRQ